VLILWPTAHCDSAQDNAISLFVYIRGKRCKEMIKKAAADLLLIFRTHEASQLNQ
jgi:hypothetical protein